MTETPKRSWCPKWSPRGGHPKQRLRAPPPPRRVPPLLHPTYCLRRCDTTTTTPAPPLPGLNIQILVACRLQKDWEKRKHPERQSPHPAFPDSRTSRITGGATTRTSWRNGSASDSRSEGCVFKSRRGQEQRCWSGPFSRTEVPIAPKPEECVCLCGTSRCLKLTHLPHWPCAGFSKEKRALLGESAVYAGCFASEDAPEQTPLSPSPLGSGVLPPGPPTRRGRLQVRRCDSRQSLGLEPFVSPQLGGSRRRRCPPPPPLPERCPEGIQPGSRGQVRNESVAMTTEDVSLSQEQSTEEMEPIGELLPVEFQELTTVKDEEMDFTCVEEEQMNSARRYMAMDMKVENCGNLVFWERTRVTLVWKKEHS
nr:PREDICTED: uncharacterized protein LOC106700725 [Bos mutus]